MNTERHFRMSPLAAAAAISVIVFSMAGIAAFTGLLPSANSQRAEHEAKPVVSEAKPMVSEAKPAVPGVKSAVPGAKSAAPGANERSAKPAGELCGNCGTVEAIRNVELKQDASGLGAVAGGVTGAVIGNQMGNGRGNTVMTVLGAAGGAFAGHEIEKNIKTSHVYRITVRMDDGSYRTVSQPQPPAVAVGAKVRVSDGVLVARG